MLKKEAIGQVGPDLAALAVVTIWGTNFVFLKALLSEFDPWTFLTLRFTGMIALGWVVLWVGQRRANPVRSGGSYPSHSPGYGYPGGADLYRPGLGFRRADLPLFALAGFLGHTLYITLSTIGLNYTTAFSSALLIATAPIFAGLLLWARRMEPVGVAQWSGMAVSIVGVVVFMAEKLVAGATSAGLGDVISLVGAFCFAAYTVVNKPLVARYSSSAVTTYAMTLGAIPTILLGLPATLAQDWSRITPLGWLTLAWSIVVPVYLAWTLWAWVGKRLGVGRTAVFMYLVPLVGGVTSWLLLGEGFGALKVLGAALTIAGLALARRAPARRTTGVGPTPPETRPGLVRPS